MGRQLFPLLEMMRLRSGPQDLPASPGTTLLLAALYISSGFVAGGVLDENIDPIDSGFGPFALTRLCYETGGIYFAVHPNRNVHREVTEHEIDVFSCNLDVSSSTKASADSGAKLI